MYKIIASDLDETLILPDGSVTEKNRRAIKALRPLGIKFVLATGRPYNSAQKTLKELDLYDREDEYIISFNGGMITENKGNRILHCTPMDFDDINMLFIRGIQYDVCIHVYTADTVYVWNMDQDEKDYINGRMEVTEIEGDSIEFLRGSVMMKILFTNTDYAYLRKIDEDLKDLTGDMDVSYSANRYIEFNPKGVNKGQGLLKLASILGVDRKDTIAIGDNLNDLSMILDAGLGAGVANTLPDMKDQCDYITENDFRHDAIAEVIERFVLSEQK